jgi:putative transposase
MPSVKVITPILGGNYYHIFNRGVNHQLIFFKQSNYIYFLKQLGKFIEPYVSILAYCLIPNHFHFVIKVKDEIIIPVENKGRPSLQKDGDLILNEDQIGKWVSSQFRRMFITYSMAINKQENRSGSLFDKNFKRHRIFENEYLKYAIYYAHINPEKHGLIENFREYMFSSFAALTSKKATKIDRKLVYEIFDGKEGFDEYHKGMHEERQGYILE